MNAIPDHIQDFLDNLDPTPEDFLHTRIVLLNGPPGSGKDTGAEYLAAYFDGAHNVKFSEALKRSVYADVGIPYDLPIDFFDPVKEMPLDLFGGRSFRQAVIDKSENHCKRLYGDQHYGRVFLRRAAHLARQGARLLAVSDSGFTGEAKRILPYFPDHHAMLVRIRAEQRGKTFEGDSRSYIALPEIKQVDILNNGEKAAFLLELRQTVQRYFGEMKPRPRTTVPADPTAIPQSAMVMPMPPGAQPPSMLQHVRV